MTRPEAIEILEGEKTKVREAFDVAIDAMKRLEKISEVVHTVTSCEDCAYEVLYYVDTKRGFEL